MRNVLHKELFKEIRDTFGRFFAIVVIVALGVGFFAGLNGTTPDMKLTADAYFDEQNLMDFRLLCTMGFTDKDVQALEALEGVSAVEPSYSVDAVLTLGDASNVAKLHSLPTDTRPDNPAYMNRPVLLEGRMPQQPDECLLDEYAAGQLGDVLRVSPDNSKDTLDLLKYDSFTVVGIARSAYYISFQRGNSTLGNGQVGYYAMIPQDAFDSEYYLELFVTAEGAKVLPCYSDEYEALIDHMGDELETFGEARAQVRYDDITGEANEKLADAQAELDEKQAELDNAQQEFDDSVADVDRRLADARQEIADAKAGIADAQTELDDAQSKLYQGEADYKQQESAYYKTVDAAQAQLDAGYAELNAQKAQYDEAEAQLDAGYAGVAELRAQAQALEQTGQTAEAAALAAQADALEQQLDGEKQALDEAAAQIESAQAELDGQSRQLEQEKATGQAALQAARDEIAGGWQQFHDGEDALEQAKTDLADGEREYTEKEREADTEIADAQQKLDDAKMQIADAQADIDDARAELDDLKPPEWYVLDRETNPGYAGFGADADRIAAISHIFPFFFFLVAALVCLTTMTRMVEEQRTQIGVLKALGYKNSAVVSKYLLYALLASVAGSALGLAVGFQLFPTAIWNAYSILYSMPAIITAFHPLYAFAASGAAVAATLAATVAACYGELRSVPAELIRPKAPPPGRRVVLERIPALWKRLRFTQKVTARNLFRYKKRLVMTIVGIAGCTMLMLTGFGLRDSITHIVGTQFDQIHHYDARITLDGNLSDAQRADLEDYFTIHSPNPLFLAQYSVTGQAGGNSFDATLMVPEDAQAIHDFVTFRDRQSGEPVLFPNGGTVVTEKLANKLNISVGDLFTIKKGDAVSAPVTVGGITENYIYNYIYMTAQEYEQLFHEAPDYTEVFINLPDGQDEEAYSTDVLELDGVLSVTFIDKISSDFSDIMKSLDSVVWVLILCANLLAFVVLYNLVNINITERIREIATIKVLGFYDREVSSYVFRENFILTAIGIVIGLFFGIFLHQFVVQTAEVDLVMFERTILPASYLWAGALTFAFTGVVDFIMFFRLKKIDMVESLKSAE